MEFTEMSVKEKRGTAFVVMQFTEPALAAPMDFGEIIEKKPRAVKECQQRSVMIGGKRVEAGLDISEILLEKDGHIRVEASAVRHGQIGVGARPHFLTISSLRCLR